jgi:hypothetical protein
MADEITLAVKIEAAQSANTIKDLQKSLKALKDELVGVSVGSNEFKKLSHAINEAEGKIGDITDSFSTLTGSGVERTEKSLSLLREGFTKFDTGKIKLGFKALAGAMSAVPVFLLIEGFNYLREHFDELSKGSGILANVLRGVGSSLEWIKNVANEAGDILNVAFGFFSGGIDGITDAAQRLKQEKLVETLGEDLKKAAEENKEALSQQNAEYDRQIKVAKAAGKSTVELEKAKQQAIIDTNKLIVEQIIAFVRAGGELDAEKKKQLTASLNFIKDAKTEEIVIDLNHKEELKKKNEKAAEDAKKIADKENKEAAARVQSKLDMLDAFYAAGFQKEVDFAQAKIDYDNKVNAVLDEQAAKRAEAERNALAKQDEETLASIEKRKEGYKQFEQQKFELTKQSLTAIQGITDLVFAHQLRQAAGNAQKEKEIKKKQFNLNKAFGIAGATIDGVQAVQKALNNPYPLNIVLAVLSGVMAAANVVKIASTKFDDGGSVGGGVDTNASVGIGSAASAAPPVISTPQNTVDTTKFDSSGKNLEAPIPKAQVVETEVTSKQNTVSKLENQAVF